MSDVTIFEGRLSLKKTHHGRFEDAYKERVFCWISQRKAPVFCLVPIESGRVERPRGAAMVQEVSLRDCTLRVDDKTKFTLLGAHLPLKFRADKYTELELWIKHLKRAIDAAKQHDSDPTQSPQPRERPGHAALKSQEKSQDTTRQSPVSAPAPAFQLLQAAERGDVSSMSRLLESGVCVDAAPYVGYSALMAASEHGQLPAVQCLLQAGARLDADMQGGTQAIHLAAMCGHAEVVRLLCEHGAEADASTDGGTTPLMLAAMEGHVDVCLELHAQGADANAIETSVIPELEQQIAGLQHEVIQARVAAGVTGGEGGVSGGGQTDEVADANADSISTREVCTDGGQDGVLSTVGPSIWDILTGRGGEMTSGSQNATVAAAATTDDKQHAGVAFGGLVAGTALQTMSTSFQDKLQLVYGGLLSPVPAAGGAGGDMLPRSLGEHVGLQVGAALGRGLKDASRNLSSLGLTALIKAAAAGHTRVCEALITTMGVRGCCVAMCDTLNVVVACVCARACMCVCWRAVPAHVRLRVRAHTRRPT